MVLAPAAFCAIALHAARHKHSTVHGVLIGSRVGDADGAAPAVHIEQAVPVCHAAPTAPLVEVALGLLADRTVVGWYTAPALLEDAAPGPVALRLVAGLADRSASPTRSHAPALSEETDGGADRGRAAPPSREPVLVVVQNVALAACLGDPALPAADAVKAFGKDRARGEWLQPVPSTVDESTRAIKAAREALAQEYVLDDFEDHLQGPVTSCFPDRELVKLVHRTRG